MSWESDGVRRRARPAVVCGLLEVMATFSPTSVFVRVDFAGVRLADETRTRAVRGFGAAVSVTRSPPGRQRGQLLRVDDELLVLARAGHGARRC